MTLIQGREYSCKENYSENHLGSLPLLQSSNNEALVNPPADGFSKPLVAKYTEEDLQKILRTVLEAQVLPFDGHHKKPLKAKSSDMYYNKFHIKCYNFCQKCEDHFATAKVKGLNCIFFAAFFLHDYINFH